MERKNLLNDYSNTIGAEVAQAEQTIPSDPAKFVGWTWKSKSPEYLYVESAQGNAKLIQKFHFFIFAGKIAPRKETSDKVFYALTPQTCSDISAHRAAVATAQTATTNAPKLAGGK